MTTNAQKFRTLLQSSEFLVSPGVYDGYSVRLVQAACSACPIPACWA